MYERTCGGREQSSVPRLMYREGAYAPADEIARSIPETYMLVTGHDALLPYAIFARGPFHSYFRLKSTLPIRLPPYLSESRLDLVHTHTPFVVRRQLRAKQPLCAQVLSLAHPARAA